jgi:translation initiation factor IF-2
MTDSNDDKTLSGAGKKTLTLKPSGMSQGTVRQDMGRGRTKAVVVETRKRRPMRPEDEKPVTPAATGGPCARRSNRAAPPVQARAAAAARAPRFISNNSSNQRPQQPSSQSPRQTTGSSAGPCGAEPSVAGRDGRPPPRACRLARP